jgi:hypothetical protein
MNIPTRYCTGYLSDIGTRLFEAYLGGRWHMFEPRNNVPRIGRILIAQGRDDSDVPITQTFGPNTLLGFEVWRSPNDRSIKLFSLRDIVGEDAQIDRAPCGFAVVAIRDHRIGHGSLEIIVPEPAGQIAGLNP